MSEIQTLTHSETPQDEAAAKGAVEEDTVDAGGKRSPQNSSLSGQLGHRDQDPLLKESDAGLPEPDAHAEHSGR